MTHKVSYTFFDWLSGESYGDKKAKQDALNENQKNNTPLYIDGKLTAKPVQRAERTFMPDVCSDEERRNIAHRNREMLLERQYKQGQGDPEALSDYITQRYLTPNPSNNNRIVIDEARRLYSAQVEYYNFVNDASQKSRINHDLFFKNKKRELDEATAAFNSVLPDLLEQDRRYYNHKVTQKNPNPVKKDVKYRHIIGDFVYSSQESAPKKGEQTEFLRQAAKSSKTATVKESLADAQDFWGISAKEKPKYERDLIDKVFSFSFFKSKK